MMIFQEERKAGEYEKNASETSEHYRDICDNTYSYYLGTNKNKTYKKEKRSTWKEEFDFN